MHALSTERLLALDCASQHLSVALSTPDIELLWHEPVGAAHAEHILPVIEQLLHEAGVSLGELDAIVYNQGPGGFTGLRIGLGVAQGLALSQHIPLIGVPALDAVASLAFGQPRVLATLDARMDEIFYAWFDAQHHLLRLSPDRVHAPDHIIWPEGLAHEPESVFAVGSGLAIAGFPFSGSLKTPSALDFIRLARSGAYAPTRDADLKYVRQKVALTAAEQQAARAGKMTIAPVLPAQAATIAHIHAACHAPAWSLEQITDSLRHARQHALVARVGDAPGAFLLWQDTTDSADILLLDTLPDYRRRGLARRLLSRLQERYPLIHLDVRADNQPACALYQAAGFEIQGQRSNYYADGADALLMQWRRT